MDKETCWYRTLQSRTFSADLTVKKQEEENCLVNRHQEQEGKIDGI